MSRATKLHKLHHPNWRRERRKARRWEFRGEGWLWLSCADGTYTKIAPVQDFWYDAPARTP